MNRTCGYATHCHIETLMSQRYPIPASVHRVEEEIDSWIRAGLARTEGTLVSVDASL